MGQKRTIWDWPAHLKSKTVIDENGCWVWQAATVTGDRSRGFYGCATYGGKGIKAHRLMFQLLNPDVDINGKYICHTCDNTLCINPAHLYAGTPNDNVQDKMRRGRHKPMRGVLNGHAKLTEDQVRLAKERIAIGVTCARLARDFGVDKATISKIKHGKSWRHI